MKQTAPVVRPPGQGLSKSANRRRKRADSYALTSPKLDMNVIYPQQPGQISRTNIQATKTYASALKMATKVSPEGLRFLKCAFAPADFDGSALYGVPDDFGGRSLALKHRLVGSTTFPAAFDAYLVQIPVPGVAYYVASVAAGAGIVANTVFTPVYYSDFSSIFPSATELNRNTTKFRMVSNHIEVVNTTNNNTWTGNIQCFKVPLQSFTQTPAVPTNASYLGISGLRALNSTNEDMYSGAFNFGVYSGAFNRGAKFDFFPILGEQTNLPAVLTASDFGQLAGFITGFDNNMETTVVKISGVTGATNTAIIRAWSCVEYQFSPGNAMYIAQQMHTECDKLALEIYKKVAIELPAGVSALDNENFWERVLGIIAKMGMTGAVLPGPYGLASGSVGGLALAMKQMLF